MWDNRAVDDSIDPSSATRRRLWRAVVAALAAAALLTLGTWFGVTHDDDGTAPTESAPSTGRDVIESSLAVTGAAESLQGVMIGGEVRRGEFRELTRFAFVLTADGRIARRYLPPPSASASATPPTTSRSASPIARSTPIATGPGPGTGPIFMPSLPVVRYESVYLPAEWSSHDVVVTSETPPLWSSSSFPTLTAYSDERSSLASGWPHCDVTETLLPYVRLRSYMRVLLAGESPDLRDVTFAGRDAWELTTIPRPARHVVPQPGEGATARLDDAIAIAPMTIVIDKETRVPLSFRWRDPRRGVLELRMLDVRLDAGVDADAFVLRVPEDAVSGDPGPDETVRIPFTPLDLTDVENARETLGDLPGYPAWRPQGYSLTDSTWAPTPLVPAAMGASEIETLPGSPPPATLSLAYRRGSDSFAVAAWPTWVDSRDGATARDRMMGSGGLSTSNGADLGPFARSSRGWTTRVRLEGGAFEGRLASLVLDPCLVPQLRVRDETCTATISGDLSPAEMVKVAESLGAPWMEE